MTWELFSSSVSQNDELTQSNFLLQGIWIWDGKEGSKQKLQYSRNHEVEKAVMEKKKTNLQSEWRQNQETEWWWWSIKTSCWDTNFISFIQFSTRPDGGDFSCPFTLHHLFLTKFLIWSNLIESTYSSGHQKESILLNINTTTHFL